MPPLRIDVVCRVVDNFGDAGVCWRLCRQLASEHAASVRLAIDDVATLARIAPSLDPNAVLQRASGVEIRQLDERVPDGPLPDAVVTAFGAALPDAWLHALAASRNAPAWVVLEHLSAEDWVDGAHGLPSPHPRLPLARWVFFPGFTPATGGMLRERELMNARDAFAADAHALDATWASMGLSPPGEEEVAVFVFCYPNDALPALFDAWADGGAPVRAVVPEGVAAGALERWAAGAVPRPGRAITRRALTLAVVPFTDQDAFDRRLWACDLDVVRGEDSFVRAQWAAQPLVWHAYPQRERAHVAKREAFLARYLDAAPREGAAALARFTRAFCDEDPLATAAAWPDLRAALPELRVHARRWADARARSPDLATSLVQFVRERL
jgi:uncharacterized repeat protein (TIGR03837 family)